MIARLSQHRTTLLLVAGVLVILGVVVLNGLDGDSGRRLDPARYQPEGGRATAEVLRGRGVEVAVVRSADALAEAGAGAGDTVLVTSTDALGDSTLERLQDDTSGARLVLVEPPPHLTGPLKQPEGVSTLAENVAAACDDPLFADLELAVDSAVAYPTAQGCFPVDSGYLLARADRDTLLLGSGQMLSNDQVLRADNSAATLRLLGQDERLVWYVPDPADLTGEDGVGLSGLLPPWLVPGLWLSGVAFLAVMLWRGRRLGPLVREPLPVAVRAIETTHSRGRLYRRAADRAHAARALRAVAAENAVRRLNLPPHTTADPARLVRDLAHHTGRSPTEIADLLGPDAPTPAHDQDLVTLAGRLAELDREVRRR